MPPKGSGYKTSKWLSIKHLSATTFESTEAVNEDERMRLSISGKRLPSSYTIENAIDKALRTKYIGYCGDPKSSPCFAVRRWRPNPKIGNVRGAEFQGYRA
jgi:hypothetical protein